MSNGSFDILFELFHAAIIGAIFTYLWIMGGRLFFHEKKGWQFILAGFGLLFFGTLIDITDNFPVLNRFIIIGDTRYQALLEKVFGYTLGSIMLAIGFWKFLPAVFALRESEGRLRANEERLRKIFEFSPISMAIVTMNGTIEYINRRAVDTFGYQPEDIPDMDRWWSLAYPDELYRNEVIAQWMGLLEEAIKSDREIERREYRVTCKDGTLKTMVIFGVLVVDKVFVMFEDITERKQAEEMLRESENRYQIFTANTSDYVYRCSRRGMDPFRVNWMAGAIEQITGYSTAEIFQMACWLKIVHPDDRARVSEYLMKLAPGERNAAEFRIVTKAGDIRWIQESSYCEAGEVDDEIIHYGSSQDITISKNAQDEIHRLNYNLENLVTERTNELLRSNRELASFCYAISHELHAPVARLRGLSQALLEELADNPAEAEHCASRIIVASSQLQSAIDSVLQLSRLSQATFTPRLFNLSGMFREIATALVSETNGRQIELIIAEDITALGDPSLVRLCLENLLSNAIKYTVREPVAFIEFGRDSANKALFVRDNGIGFDMAYADKLFEPFVRLHKEEDFSGSGIGLATVQRIIDRHSGRIWAESAPGQGATFFFTLTPDHGEYS